MYRPCLLGRLRGPSPSTWRRWPFCPSSLCCRRTRCVAALSPPAPPRGPRSLHACSYAPLLLFPSPIAGFPSSGAVPRAGPPAVLACASLCPSRAVARPTRVHTTSCTHAPSPSSHTVRLCPTPTHQLVEGLTGNYVACLGAYRALYIINWIYKAYAHPGYVLGWSRQHRSTGTPAVHGPGFPRGWLGVGAKVLGVLRVGTPSLVSLCTCP